MGVTIVLSQINTLRLNVVIASQHAYENECNQFTTRLRKWVYLLHNKLMEIVAYRSQHGILIFINATLRCGIFFIHYGILEYLYESFKDYLLFLNKISEKFNFQNNV